MTKVYLVRHGEAVGNVTHVFQGLSDLPLTENGRKQAALVGERMKKIHLDKVYASQMSPRIRQRPLPPDKGLLY